MDDQKDFALLSDTERARVVAAIRLMKHFRGLEQAGLMSTAETGKHIGAVKILEAQAKGEFIPH